MATDKPRITAYVRSDLFESFDQFCKNYEVKHSKGIELLLGQYFKGEIPSEVLSDTPTPALTRDEVEQMIATALAEPGISITSSHPLSNSPSQEIASLVDEVKSLGSRLGKVEQWIQEQGAAADDTPSPLLGAQSADTPRALRETAIDSSDSQSPGNSLSDTPEPTASRTTGEALSDAPSDGPGHSHSDSALDGTPSDRPSDIPDRSKSDVPSDASVIHYEVH